MWVLISALLLVDPDFTISSLKNNFDALLYLSLFIWREHRNVTPTEGAIRDSSLGSNPMMSPLVLFLGMKQRGILWGRERLPQDVEAKSGATVPTGLDIVLDLCNPTRSLSIALLEDLM